MVKMVSVYQGQLHCSLTHEPSNSVIETDAPKDNQGRGEKFSPTDLMGAALGSCILTTMAIAAERDGIAIKGATAHVSKEMVADPARRVGALTVVVTFATAIAVEYRSKLEKVGLNCPVQKSLHPDLKTSVTFIYP